MSLRTKPRIGYSQPAAICRTLVFNWAGSLLCTRDHETQIIHRLASQSSPGPGLTYMKQLQNMKHQTANWRSTTQKVDRPVGGGFEKRTINRGVLNFSNTNEVFSSVDRKHHAYDCFAIVPEALLDTKNYHPKLIFELLKCSSTTRTQAAYALTILYRYGNGDESGHCVGLFFSRGGFGARSAGGRFFDPNVGTWQFGSHRETIDFVMSDWLPNFVANTMKGDPGHAKKGPREVKGYRLSQFMDAALAA
ncbi:hypothetical protein [Reyranella sp. CPCC 100927]|uniref:hypothetical protein n=1 Tax=Reyranella sp. CPCC 100927 TaxID=2599616 RepID=UPI0011B40681|nr:hypothetical protein [Reyranella sp. CPCC 100927]TWT15556.1 hypothetical protein FQU96_04175 [Reyranella sp. CPCC 100927]